MKTLLFAALAVSLSACQMSFSTLDGSADSETDPGTDTDTDAIPDTVDDTATDTFTDTTPPPGDYALHEWGVMVMGPEGATTHGPTPAYAGPIPAKPVIYLYADEPLELDVAVTFASGGATEVWPEVDLGSRVAWNGISVAPGACDTTAFPSPMDDPWTEGFCEACTLGQVVVGDAACIGHGDQVARLLFYTGALPDYDAPLEVSYELAISGDGSTVVFSVENTTDQVVEDVWLVYRDTTDWCIDPSACPVATADIAWVYLDAIEPYSGEGFSMPVMHFEAELDEYGWPVPGTLGLPDEWVGLSAQATERLVAHGLTADEAEAFMNAWEGVYFGLMGTDSGFIDPFYSNGAAAIYFMSREDYDAQLPLETSLAPDELVRVGMVYERM